MLRLLWLEYQRWTGIPFTWLLLGISSWYPCLVKTLQCVHCACCNCYYYLIMFMFPETAVKPPWRELFSKNLFQQCAVMVAIDEAHCIHEWLEHAYFITIITRAHVPYCIVQGAWLLDGIPQDGGLRASQKFCSCASCLSFSSIRVGDYSSSRAHKSCFCEELLQESQVLILCHNEITYEHVYKRFL